MKNSILYIINSAGHGGIGIRSWNELKAIWPEYIDPESAIITKRPGNAPAVAVQRSLKIEASNFKQYWPDNCLFY